MTSKSLTEVITIVLIHYKFAEAHILICIYIYIYKMYAN